MKVVTIKKLVTEDNKEFTVGCNIAFTHVNKKKIHRYIGEIESIGKNTFTINQIEIDRIKIGGSLTFIFNRCKDFNYVFAG